MYAPWAKARDYPVLALENDGQPYPPNIVSRVEVFAHNVLRFEAVDRLTPAGIWRGLAERIGLGRLPSARSGNPHEPVTVGSSFARTSPTAFGSRNSTHARSRGSPSSFARRKSTAPLSRAEARGLAPGAEGA